MKIKLSDLITTASEVPFYMFRHGPAQQSLRSIIAREDLAYLDLCRLVQHGVHTHTSGALTFRILGCETAVYPAHMLVKALVVEGWWYPLQEIEIALDSEGSGLFIFSNKGVTLFE